ncbi:uncharacterized protein Z520_09512 [Fonsecaea multimorphosa CBS 102226]|uniref:Clr5 domain-containing protein n=1 Tax=Fonsecaea multimorphosa CBS 102226 TaxID=1442371 RepID=A0A0D2JN94_9EURO|nr:uncharacterized protein Z520_09512 [Fonsecaea multimorphosa CBS 102226]KIX94822.1 hypothetical protein Z520_09512 [Fonsecaea multimorphosa CBS 102226]OAL20400.1 hypothetical protein AYO22_08894 [Fonsecaea multimorphosa]
MLPTDDAGAQGHTLSAQDWSQYKQIIYDLYISQNLPLTTIRERLLDEYSFHASIPQYKRKLKEWRYSKNLKASTCKALGDSLERRGLTGTNAVTEINGVTLSSKRLQRALRRHHIPTLKRKFGLEQRASTPEGISFRGSSVEPTTPFPRIAAIEVPSGVKYTLQLQLSHPMAVLLDDTSPPEIEPPINCLAKTGLSQPRSERPRGSSNDHLAVPAVEFIYLDDSRQPSTAKTRREAAAARLLNYLPLQEPDRVIQDLDILIHQDGSIDLTLLTSNITDLCANNFLNDIHRIRSVECLVLEYLLSAGADPNAPLRDCSFDRETLLQFAVKRENTDLIKLLLRYGADANAPPTQGYRWTALQAASKGGNLELVELLLNYRADVNAPPAETGGRTALQAASGYGNLQVVELLLNHKADVNAPPAERFGRTALQAASEGENIQIVELLLKHEADVNAPPTRWGGLNALQAAAEKGNLTIAQLLLAAGADVGAPMGGLAIQQQSMLQLVSGI